MIFPISQKLALTLMNKMKSKSLSIVSHPSCTSVNWAITIDCQVLVEVLRDRQAHEDGEA